MRCVEVTCILNENRSEEYHILRFDDEEEITVNLIENGKFIAHHTMGLRRGLLGALELKEGQIITDSKGNRVKCIMRQVKEF